MLNGCLKNISLISLECDFDNFLYSIEVKERYSYKNGLLDCIRTIEWFICKFSSTQKAVRGIFNKEYTLPNRDSFFQRASKNIVGLFFFFAF